MTDETSIDKTLKDLVKRVKTKAKAEKARRKPTEVTDYKPAGLIFGTMSRRNRRAPAFAWS
jgi:hypothetical protein